MSPRLPLGPEIGAAPPLTFPDETPDPSDHLRLLVLSDVHGQALAIVGSPSVVGRIAQHWRQEESEAMREALWETMGKLDSRPPTGWEKLLGRRRWTRYGAGRPWGEI